MSRNNESPPINAIANSKQNIWLDDREKEGFKHLDPPSRIENFSQWIRGHIMPSATGSSFIKTWRTSRDIALPNNGSSIDRLEDRRNCDPIVGQSLY